MASGSPKIDLEVIPCSIDQPLIVNIPVNGGRIKQAFEILKSRLITGMDDQFQILTDIVDHSDIYRRVGELLEQYKNADEDFLNYIRRLPVNKAGQQFAKAFVTGTKSRWSISVIATSRKQTKTSDQHKFLIATLTKTFEVRSLSNEFPGLFSAFLALPVILLVGPVVWLSMWSNVFSVFNIRMDTQVKDILEKLNDEENRQCMEAMTFYILGVKIRESVGTRVEVRFVTE
jgi:hypothetical protein